MARIQRKVPAAARPKGRAAGSDDPAAADTVLVKRKVPLKHIVQFTRMLATMTDAGLPVLRADARMTKQMLINLLTNAVKFTPNRGEIAVLATLDQLGALRLAVRDTGVGIAAGAIPKVLESFGQADNSRAGVSEGTGLGLPLVKSFVELHGGHIDVESSDAGTKITSYLPMDVRSRPAS